MAAQWQTVREAADALGVSPDTLVRRMRSGGLGTRDGANDTGGAFHLNEDAPVPPPPAMPVPRPQSNSATGPAPHAQPLPKPPLCTLPPAKPLPPAGSLPTPTRRSSGAAPVAEQATGTGGFLPPRDRMDDAFMAAVEAELTELRNNRGGGFVPAYLPASPAVKAAEPSKVTAPILDMAHPLHAQVQDARKQLRGMWAGIGLLLLAVVVGVGWTTTRMDRADRMITELLQQLDAERTLVSTYKQEISRLYTNLNESKAQNAKLTAEPARDARQNKRPSSKLTSTGK